MKYTRHTIQLAAWLLLPLGAAPLAAATRTWDGSGSPNDWSLAANWTSNIAPVAGDSLVFPNTLGTIPVTIVPFGDRVTNNNLAANTDFAGLTFSGSDYTISGNTLDLISGGILLNYTAAGTTTISANVAVAGVGQSIDTGTGSGILQLDGNLLLSGNSLTLTGSGDFILNGQIGNNAGTPILTKAGAGTATIAGFNNFSGDIEVTDGTLYATGLIAGAGVLNVRNGAILAGDDGGITKNTLIQGTLAPGSATDPTLGMVFDGGLTFSPSSTSDRTLHLDLRGLVANTSYDQIEAGGTVSLNSSNLTLEFSTFKPAVGTVFTLINKTSAGAITGTFSGIAQGAIVVKDGQSLQFSYTGGDGNDLTATVLNVTPTAAAQNVTTDEDTPLAITLSATDPNPQTLTYAVVSNPSKGTLTGTAPNLTYTPNANASGADSFTFHANDGTANGNTATVSITVNAVNDPPTASGLSTAETYTEDTTRNLANIVVADVDSSTVTATLTLSNPAAGSLTVGTSGSATSTFLNGVWTVTGSVADVNSRLAAVSFVPTPNFNANFTIATSVSDGVAPAVTGTKNMTGTAVNDAPVVTAIAAQTTNEDTAIGPIAFTISDVETAPGSLEVTFGSTITSLVQVTNITPGGSGANRTLSITPAANQTGTSIISVNVSDGTVPPTTTSFLLTVSAVNDLPTITSISNRTINEDTATSAIAFTVGDVETAAASLTVTAESSNETLLPPGGIALSAPAASRTVTLTPAPGQHGASTVTLTVSDGTGTRSISFLLTVTAVNDMPAFSKGPDIKVVANSSASSFPLWATDISDGDSEVTQTLTFNISNPNSALFSVQPAISSTGTLSFTPAPGMTGTAAVSVSLTDDATAGGTALTTAVQTFNINIVAPLSGTVTVGPGGSFTSLTGIGGLFDNINQRVLTGDLTAQITGNLTETGLIALNAVEAIPAGSTPVIRIHPAGAASTITGTAATLIRLNGADRVIFDGSLNGTGTDRSLSVQNLSTVAQSAVIWQQPAGTDGCTDNVFRNLIIAGSTAGGQTFAGIGAGSTTPNESVGTGHHRNTYQNNSFSGVRVGIFSSGNTTAPNEDTLITGNEMIASAPLHLRRAGILVLNENRPVISGNVIASVSDTTNADSYAISAGFTDLIASATSTASVTNAQITGNRIRGVAQLNTFSSAGIAVAGGATGTNLIANNAVAGIEGNPVLADICAGIVAGGANSSATRILYNSISVSGSIVPTVSIASAESHFGIALGGGNPVIELRNNAIRNAAVNLGVPARKSYALGSASTTFTNLTASNNVYFTPAGAGFAFAKTGSLSRSAGTDWATLADWQVLTGQDSASQFGDPLFTSLLDLNPQSGSPLIAAGVPVAGVTTDINGEVRSTTAPTVGAFGGGGETLTALQQWRQTHFGSPDNSGSGADDADADADGLTTLVEYAFGLDPNSGSQLTLPQPEMDGSDLVLSFTPPPGVTGVTYTGEKSTSLAEGSWTPVANTGTAPVLEFRTPATGARTFLRVRITAP